MILYVCGDVYNHMGIYFGFTDLPMTRLTRNGGNESMLLYAFDYYLTLRLALFV